MEDIVVMSIGEFQWLMVADNTKLRKEYEGKEILLVNLREKVIIGTVVLSRKPKQYKLDEVLKLK